MIVMTGTRSPKEHPPPLICLNNMVDASAIEYVIYVVHIQKVYLEINRANLFCVHLLWHTSLLHEKL